MISIIGQNMTNITLEFYLNKMKDLYFVSRCDNFRRFDGCHW